MKLSDYIVAFLEHKGVTTVLELSVGMIALSEYTGYLLAIQSFVTANEIRPFSAEGFSEHFINQIVPPTLSR